MHLLKNILNSPRVLNKFIHDGTSLHLSLSSNVKQPLMDTKFPAKKTSVHSNFAPLHQWFFFLSSRVN